MPVFWPINERMDMETSFESRDVDKCIASLSNVKVDGRFGNSEEYLQAVLKDGADAGGLSFWEGEITSGRATRGTLVTNILDSAHTFKGDKTWGWVADLLDNKITVAKKFSIDMGLNYNTPEESITKGMAIASAITPTDTTAAVTLIGVTEANFLLV